MAPFLFSNRLWGSSPTSEKSGSKKRRKTPLLSLWRRMHARQGAMARPGRRIRGEEWVPTNLPCSVPGKALRWAGRRWAAHPGGTNFGGESGSTNFEAASTVVNVPARAGTGGETTLRWRLASRLIYRPGVDGK